MRKILALLWLAVVCAGLVHILWASRDGVPLQTDLMALLPAEERDPVLAEAKAKVSQKVSRQVVLLVGHVEPKKALRAAASVRDRLVADGVLEAGAGMPDSESVRRLGRLYFPHRQGLLAEADRAALLDGRAGDLVQRGLAQVYGIGGMADARMMAEDPFLTFPAFLADLPFGGGRFAIVDGWPIVRDGGTTWAMIGGRVIGDALSLRDQDRFVESFRSVMGQIREGVPDLQVKRLGAVFFAQAAATEALGESALIGTISLAGTIILILGIFRSVWPLLITVLAVAVGLVCALSVSLAGFGSLHVAVTIFGASLMGVTVDYSLHYWSRAFGKADHRPKDRLAHVLPGITLGLATTLVGYMALMVSPLPGLHQVAVFSAIGLCASFLTVVLWFPLLDRVPSREMPGFLRDGALLLWRLWDDRAFRPARVGLAVVLISMAGAGATVFSADDDIRRQQRLDPTLAREQDEVRRLIGNTTANQFFLVRAGGPEDALRLEEQLAERLARVKTQGGLNDWRSPARLVPSVDRQLANAKLRTEILDLPHLAPFRARVGLPANPAGQEAGLPLRLSELAEAKAIPFLDLMVLDPGLHVVALDGVKDLAALREAARGLDGIAFVDPAADLSELLERYRNRALWLIAASAGLMALVLAFRHGIRGTARILLPPLGAVLLTPLLLALVGIPFTFFGAMALILVLSMGVDYAVFCAESHDGRDPITVLAVWLAMLTTALAFGLMAFSQVAGVRSFGAVMLVGIMLAFLLAPFAGRVDSRRIAHAR